MNEQDITKWIGDYINFWADGQSMPTPDDFANFNSGLKSAVDSKISSFKDFIAGIPDDQLLSLFQETKKDDKGVDQPYMAQAFLTSALAAPYWFWYRLNCMYRSASLPSDLWNYFISSYNTAYAISSTWATIKKHQSGDVFDLLLTILTTWNTGSINLIEAMAKDKNGNPIYKNCMSMTDLSSNAQAVLLDTDGSTGNGVPEANLDFLTHMENGLIGLGGCS